MTRMFCNNSLGLVYLIRVKSPCFSGAPFCGLDFFGCMAILLFLFNDSSLLFLLKNKIQRKQKPFEGRAL